MCAGMGEPFISQKNKVVKYITNMNMNIKIKNTSDGT
jgi:hypothetical protein